MADSGLAAPYRETFEHAGWVVDGVRAHPRLDGTSGKDSARRVWSLLRMCAGAWSSSTGTVRPRRSRRSPRSGSPPALRRTTQRELDAVRYGLTDLLDDMAGCDREDELVYLAGAVRAARPQRWPWSAAGRWSGTGKALGRALPWRRARARPSGWSTDIGTSVVYGDTAVLHRAAVDVAASGRRAAARRRTALPVTADYPARIASRHAPTCCWRPVPTARRRARRAPAGRRARRARHRGALGGLGRPERRTGLPPRLVLVRATWDYDGRRDAFLDWAARSAPWLLNGTDVLRLEHRQGLPRRPRRRPTSPWSRPSLSTSRRRRPPWSRGAAARPWSSARRGRRPRGRGLRRRPWRPTGPATTLASAPGPWVVQPLVESVRTEGETSVFVLGGEVVAQVRQAARGRARSGCTRSTAARTGRRTRDDGGRRAGASIRSRWPSELLGVRLALRPRGPDAAGRRARWR